LAIPALLAIFKALFFRHNIAYYGAVHGWIKSVILALVVFAILYVVISPLPELAATCFSKATIHGFTLVAVVAGLPVPAAGFVFGPSFSAFTPPDTVLNKICVRLC